MAKYLQQVWSLWSASRAAALLGRHVLLRFVIAGIVNTLFGFLVYVVGIVCGASVWLALLLGMLLGTVFNFYTTGGYAFRQLSLSRYPRFVACYFLVYFANIVSINVLSQWMSNHLALQGVLLAPIAVLSYVLMSRLVFGKRV